jgi:hypothetical protein
MSTSDLLELVALFSMLGMAIIGMFYDTSSDKPGTYTETDTDDEEKM